MKTKSRIAKSSQQLRDAERALDKAKLAHRAAFRKALVALFNEYGFYLDANGSEGARLEIEELRDGRTYPIEELPK